MSITCEQLSLERTCRQAGCDIFASVVEGCQCHGMGSCQIREIVGCACAGNARYVSPTTVG